MALPIRGDKSQVRILVNAQPVAWTELTNMTFNESTQPREYHYIGRRLPVEDAMMMGFEGQITGLVTNSSIDDVIQSIRAARKSGVNLPVVNIVYSEQYENGTTATFMFTDVQLILANRTGAGADEPISKAVSFKAADLIRIS